MTKKKLFVVLLVVLLVVARAAYVANGRTDDGTIPPGVPDNQSSVVTNPPSGDLPTGDMQPGDQDTAPESAPPEGVIAGNDGNQAADSAPEKALDSDKAVTTPVSWPSRIADFDDAQKYPRPIYTAVSPSAFGVDYSELNGDKLAAVHAFYEICCNQPETLASAVSAFPSLLAQCEVATSDPTEIDYMLDSESGAALQRALLEALDALLDDPRTNVAFEALNEDTWMLYMYTRDPKQPSSPPNIGLVWVPLPADSSPQLLITYHGAGGDEVGRFDMQLGFPRNVARNSDQNAIIIS